MSVPNVRASEWAQPFPRTGGAPSAAADSTRSNPTRRVSGRVGTHAVGAEAPEEALGVAHRVVA